MITLKTPVSFGAETDAVASMASAKGDALNNRLEVVEVYGNGTSNSNFAPSSQLPATFVQVNLTTGNIYVNGVILMNTDTPPAPVALTATQIASIKSTMTSFQSAVENELVALGIFAGAVS